MLEHVLRVLKHSAIYSVGSVAEKGLAFLLVPLYTRYLTPEDYGVLGILTSTLAIMIIFSSLGVLGGLAMSYNQKQDELERRKAVGTALLVTIVGSLVLASATALFSKQLSAVLFSTASYSIHIRLLAVIIFSEAILTAVFVTLRTQEKSVRYVATVTVKFLIGTALSVLFVVSMGWGVKGVLAGMAVSGVALALYTVPVMCREVRPLLSWEKFKGMLSYGVPYIPSNIIYQVMALSDKYFLQFMVGSSAVGLYTLGGRFGMAVSAIVVTPFVAAWGPFFWAIHKQDNAMEVYARITTYYVLVAVGVTLALAVMAKEVIQVMATREFLPAYKVVGMISLAWVLQGAVNLMSLGMALAKKTWWVPAVTAVGAVANLGLNWLMIPRWGIEGAALATVLSFAVVPTGMLVVSRRYFRIPYEWGRIGKVVIVAGVVMGVSLVVNGESVAVNVTVKGMMLMAFPAGLWLVRFFRREEIAKVKEWVRV